METLDVTKIEPKFKHKTIFDNYDMLINGESMVIENDHDPKPLYYEMAATRGNTFSWEYLENGPEWWKVRIQKNAAPEEPQHNEVTIGEMVREDYRKAEVFKKFNIDFCCGGKKTLDQVTKRKSINKEELIRELNALDTVPDATKYQFDDWSLTFLTDFIINNHHAYVEKNIPVLYEYTQKVARVHGDRHPELVEVATLFAEVANELQSHMHKEEAILFPFVKEIESAYQSGRPASAPPFGSLANPIRMMEAEHESAGGALDRIREITNNYTPPADACNTYRVTFSKLKEFEDDLHQHVHLENNILFPKAIALETKIKG